MSENSQNKYRDTELDPDLLLTSFKIQTNWHVISGAPSSGKTTMIDQLADKGFHIFPEVARQYFERELEKGRTIDEIREDRAALTCEIYTMWVDLVHGLRTDEVIFHDRGIPDGLAFFRIAGMDPNEILPDCFQHRYVSVFFLDRLPYQQDGIRGGDDASAAYMESWMIRDYHELGYNVIRVPVLPPEERLAFILERL